MLTVPVRTLATYQQIVQQDWYQYQEDNPENEGDWKKGNFFLTLLLVEKVIIVQFSSCHGHHLHNSTSRMGECISLENESMVGLGTTVCKTAYRLYTGYITVEKICTKIGWLEKRNTHAKTKNCESMHCQVI